MIGAGGKLIQSISDDCGGVAIKFPGILSCLFTFFKKICLFTFFFVNNSIAPDAHSDKVTIRGPKEDVEKAKNMLMELSNERQLNSISATIR